MAAEVELEPWQHAWRYGLAPQLPTRGLVALRAAVIQGDPTLIQGHTTLPHAGAGNETARATGACAVAYAGWKGENLATVGQVEEYFLQRFLGASRLLDAPAAASVFVRAFDSWSLAERRREFLPEIERELARREVANGRE